MKKVILMASIGLLFVQGAFGAEYSDWYTVNSFPTTIKLKVMKNDALGYSVQQAFDNADRLCPVDKYVAKGDIVIAYRLSVRSSGSAYVFLGNCDLKVADKRALKALLKDK